MEGEWSYYRGGEFREGEWSCYRSLMENGHVREVVSLM